MDKQRLTITLDYEVWNILKLQAKVHERSLGKHINSILRGHVGVEDPVIRDAIIRLEQTGSVTYIATKDDLAKKLGSQSHFKVEGDSLDGTSSRLSSHHGAGKYTSV